MLSSGMGEPRYQSGDQVRVLAASGPTRADCFIDTIARSSVFGVYEIAAVLPEAQGEPQYRLKGHAASMLERVVRESDLAPATPAPQPRR